MWGACPLRRGEFERGIPLSCCRPGRALFIPYNSVLYKKGRPHRPVTNTGGRPGANRPVFSRFAFCIRSSYTVGAPAAISRRNAPRVIKSARAGNAVDVGTGGRLRPAVRPGRFWRPFRSLKMRPASADPGAGPNTYTKPGLNMGTWPASMPAPSGVCTAGSVRLPAALPDGGAWGVAAVCRRPGKDPPRQFGERAFPGFPGCRQRTRLCGERAAQAEAEVERSEGEGEAQGRPVVGGALRF